MNWLAPVSTSRAADRHRRLAAAASGVPLAAAVLAGVLIGASPALRWPVVWRWLFNPFVLGGVLSTVELTVLAQALAVAVGVVVALLGHSGNRAASWTARSYTWLFRSVPLLVQLLFWFDIAIVLPVIRLPGLPLAVPVNDLVSGFTAAILGLGLHEAAYQAEIIRGGFLSVPQPQVDAALDLGLTRGQAIRQVVLPQALRVIVPATGNQLVGLLKASSLVSAIGGGDLLTRIQALYGANYQVIPLLTVATLWYLALVLAFTGLQHAVEAWLGRRSP